MLVFTRTPGQRIRINGNVVIEVLGHKGRHIRIGIIAPREVAIDREEIHEAKLRNPSPR